MKKLRNYTEYAEARAKLGTLLQRIDRDQKAITKRKDDALNLQGRLLEYELEHGGQK